MKGGHCLVSWVSVCSPKRLGGLGLPNIRLLNTALHSKWAWLQRVDPQRPWSDFDLDIPQASRDLFEAGSRVVLRNGMNTWFWYDPWLDGRRIEEVAPNLFAALPAGRIDLSVANGLRNNSWVQCINPNLSPDGIAEFLFLWHWVGQVVLPETADSEDFFGWKWSPKKTFTAKSAYQALFEGRTELSGYDHILNSKAPAKCKCFLWLVIRCRCWTADRLRKRGLGHPEKCPLCDQEQETIDHLLLGCVTAREVWFQLLNAWNKVDWLPTINSELAEWWSLLNVVGKQRQELATVVTLTAWCIWKQRNKVVFEGEVGTANKILQTIRQEGECWKIAGLLSDSLFGNLGVEWRDTG